MGMKDYFMMAAAGLMAAASNPEMFEKPAQGPTVHCSSCEHCPIKPKTFCKKGGKHTTPNTVVKNCSEYSRKDNSV